VIRGVTLAISSFLLGGILALLLAQKASERRDHLISSVVHAKEITSADVALKEGRLLDAYNHEMTALRVVANRDALLPYRNFEWTMLYPAIALALEPVQMSDVKLEENRKSLEEQAAKKSEELRQRLKGQL